MDTLIRIIALIIGISLVLSTLLSAIKSFVLPRSAPDRISRTVFRTTRFIINFILRFTKTYSQRDRIMAFYAPTSLVLLVPVWIALLILGFSLIYWGVGSGSWYESFMISGSSALTLGFTVNKAPLMIVLSYFEATFGLVLIALLIAYLPTIYAAFSRREVAVSLLQSRAGDPPSAIELIMRYNRIHGFDHLSDMWGAWETWFAEIEESHSSLPFLVFYRSPKPNQSWVIAAGVVLDAASLTLSSLDLPNDPTAALCIRSGFIALRTIADFFNIPYDPDPLFPRVPISVTRQEFDLAYHRLAQADVPLKKDMNQAWQDFAGWRVNYDSVLIALAKMTSAPESHWTGETTDRTKRLPDIKGKYH